MCKCYKYTTAKVLVKVCLKHVDCNRNHKHATVNTSNKKHTNMHGLSRLRNSSTLHDEQDTHGKVAYSAVFIDEYVLPINIFLSQIMEANKTKMSDIK